MLKVSAIAAKLVRQNVKRVITKTANAKHVGVNQEIAHMRNANYLRRRNRIENVVCYRELITGTCRAGTLNNLNYFARNL